MARGAVGWDASELDLRTLEQLGKKLDSPLKRLGGRTVRELLTVKLLRIRGKDGRLRWLEPNAAQKLFEERRGARNIVLKARQMGITTWIAARYFLNTITRPGTVTVLVAHDQDSAEAIFRIVHRFAENLPEAVRRGALRTSRSNARQLTFTKLDSEFRVESAADANAGRGLTIHHLHGSEVASWPGDAAGTLASLRAAVIPDGEVTLESTPQGSEGCWYREWQAANANGYVQHFFPWWMEPKYRFKGARVGELTAEEEVLVLRHGLDVEQIAYRRDLKANFGARAAQEFAEDAASCFRASGSCVFDADVLEARLRELPQPMAKRDRGQLQVWWPPVERPSEAYAPPGRKREYIIGVDPAGGGVEGDFAAMQVIDRASGMQCAEWYGHCTPEELARKAAALGREYNGALLAVERNNHGHAVLAQLETVEQYEPVFRESGRISGWLTTAVSRPRMLENLAATIAAEPELFSSARLLGECRTFVRHADGRIAAAQGCHDDAVTAMAVALAVRARG